MEDYWKQQGHGNGEPTWMEHLQRYDQGELGLFEVQFVKRLTELKHGIGHFDPIEDVHPVTGALESIRGDEVTLTVLV